MYTEAGPHSIPGCFGVAASQPCHARHARTHARNIVRLVAHTESQTLSHGQAINSHNTGRHPPKFQEHSSPTLSTWLVTIEMSALVHVRPSSVSFLALKKCAQKDASPPVFSNISCVSHLIVRETGATQPPSANEAPCVGHEWSASVGLPSRGSNPSRSIVVRGQIIFIMIMGHIDLATPPHLCKSACTRAGQHRR
jgi:hypothetical protein|eukprot:COSAG01_NODE_3420_length_6118_cov_2.065459_3_plen_196_part_00